MINLLCVTSVQNTYVSVILKLLQKQDQDQHRKKHSISKCRTLFCLLKKAFNKEGLKEKTVSKANGRRAVTMSSYYLWFQVSPSIVHNLHRKKPRETNF